MWKRNDQNDRYFIVVRKIRESKEQNNRHSSILPVYRDFLLPENTIYHSNNNKPSWKAGGKRGFDGSSGESNSRRRFREEEPAAEEVLDEEALQQRARKQQRVGIVSKIDKFAGNSSRGGADNSGSVAANKKIKFDE
jgi:hypothetical protein